MTFKMFLMKAIPLPFSYENIQAEGDRKLILSQFLYLSPDLGTGSQGRDYLHELTEMLVSSWERLDAHIYVRDKNYLLCVGLLMSSMPIYLLDVVYQCFCFLVKVE